MPPRRQNYVRTKREPETLESLNALIGEAKGAGITQEQIKECLRRMGYMELKQLPRHEYSLFAGWIEGMINHVQAAKQVDDLVLYANGEYDPRTSQRLESRAPVPREEHNSKEEDMAITMTIEASFDTVPSWLEFLSKLSVLGFVHKTGEHGLIGRAHHEHEKHGEQNVNTLEREHEKTEEPKPRKGRPPKAEAKEEHTQETLNALIGEARAAGIEVPAMKKLLARLGSDSFANLPKAKYNDFAGLLQDEIATAKAETL